MKLHQFAFFSLASAILVTSIGVSSIKPSEALTETSQPPNSTPFLLTQRPLVATFVTLEPKHPTTGQARIITENGKRYIELSPQFSTGTGPDVQVILSRSATVPLNPDPSDYTVIGKLKSFKGGQRYEIPAGVNLNNYKSVGIWCQKFNVTFGYAPF